MLPDTGPPVPPGCGRRLLHAIVDERASSGYARPVASIPRSRDISKGFRDISYSTFANAINRCAQWMLVELGKSSSLETLAYLGVPDLRYQILSIAAVKTGYSLFLPSPRNSSEIFRVLFDKAGVSNLLTTSQPPAAISDILQICNVQKYVIPELDDLLDDAPVPPIHLRATWQEYRFRPFLHIHSSGSTGIPKLITLKHGSFSGFEAQQFSGNNELGRRYSNMRVFVSFPPFHVAGLLYGLAAPIYLDNTVVLPPPVPLSAEICNSVHVKGSVELSCIPPSLVTDLVKNEEYLQNLYRLKGLAFAGGPLSDAIGDQLSSRIDLLSGIGASEWQSLPMEPKDREDWAWFKWNCEKGGLELRERDEGLYELVIVRKKEADLWQPVFVNFPNLQEFETKDLFMKHPSKPDLFKYASRLDDIIVFSNGEKLNPVTMEGTISSCPAVKGCLIVGQGRFQAAAIIEPADSNMVRGEIVTAAWPFIQQANEKTVKHGKIQRNLVIITQKSKPFPRAAKGTIQRAAATKLYVKEVEELYQSLELKASGENSTYLDLRNTESTKASLAALLENELDMVQLTESDDFFDHGVDSLQVNNLVRLINSSHNTEPIEAKQVYDHPSIEKLAHYLHDQADAGSSVDDCSDDEELQESWLAMDQMFDDMTSELVPTHESSSHRAKRIIWSRVGDNNSSDLGPVVPPDGGFLAWAQIFGSFLINVNNWGLVNAFGVFQAFYETDLLRDQSASTISWVGTLQGSLLLIVGVISGPLFDSGYFNFLLIGASLGLVFALMMLSLATQYYQVILTQGILLGICSGLLYIPSVALVPVYFKHRRGLALGIATGGGSIGGIIYPIVFRRLLGQLGFGWATRVIGFIAIITLGVAIAVIKPLGRRSRRQLLDFDAFHDVAYVPFLVAGFFIFSAILVPFFLCTSFASTSLSIEADTSFYLLAVLNAAQFLGRLLPTWYTDFARRQQRASQQRSFLPMALGPESFLLFAEFSAGVLGFAWIGVRSLGGFVVWGIIFGFVSGMVATLPAAVLPYISPNLAAYGTRLGMLYGCAGIGFLISTPVASAANGATGGFQGSQIWTGAVCCAAAGFFAVTALEARKRRLLIESGKNGRKLRDKRGKVTKGKSER